jgi:hypothetical protein
LLLGVTIKQNPNVAIALTAACSRCAFGVSPALAPVHCLTDSTFVVARPTHIAVCTASHSHRECRRNNVPKARITHTASRIDASLTSPKLRDEETLDVRKHCLLRSSRRRTMPAPRSCIRDGSGLSQTQSLQLHKRHSIRRRNGSQYRVGSSLIGSRAGSVINKTPHRILLRKAERTDKLGLSYDSSP